MLFRSLLEYTDILLVDIKHINSDEHKRLTGYPNENILDLCEYLSELGKPVWIRHVLVPGITDDDKYLKELGKYIKTLKNVEKVEVLPYHTMGVRKYKEMGIKYRLEGVEPPTADRIENAEKLLCVADYKGYLTWKPGINTKEQGL